MISRARVSLVALAFAGFSAGACGSGQSRSNPTAPPKLDLSKAGLALSIEAPAGAVAKGGGGDVSVERPPNFSMLIAEGGENVVSGTKAFLADTYKQVSYPVDTPDAIVFEIKDSNPAEVGFRAVVTTGGKSYKCGAQGPYTRADVDTMLAACRSLKAK